MRSLNITSSVAFPLDTVTQTLIVYGGKGTGKTNFGGVLAEELHAHRQRFAVIDPMGVWYGLQYSADGKGEGLDVLILGGKHGDIPITPLAGQVVADLVADETVSCVIDISRHADGKMWSRGERIRFVTDYITRLYERQGERRRPIMQIIDECARFAPQQAQKNDNNVMACLGALSQLVEEGRNVGVGVCLITQRSARLNKSVAELADCMVAFRTIGPNSVNAVLDWFGDHVERDRWDELSQTLRVLAVGEALIVSPGWLKYEGAAKVRLRHTFDSSATPTGSERRAPGQARKPDLDKYRAQMAKTIEEAKNNDPREMKKRLTELERQLKSLRYLEGEAQRRLNAVPASKIVEKPVLRNREADRLQHAINDIDLNIAALGKRLQDLASIKDEIVAALKPMHAQSADALVKQVLRPISPLMPMPKVIPSRPRPQPAVADGDFKLTAPMQRILDALAWWELLGVTSPSRAQVGLIGRVNYSGGYFDNVTNPLAAAGYVERNSGCVTLLPAGRSFAHPPEDVNTLTKYHDLLRAQIKNTPTLRIFDAILQFAEINKPPFSLTREELGEASQVNYAGGYFDNTIRPLSTMGLVDRSGGRIKTTELLFPRNLL